MKTFPSSSSHSISNITNVGGFFCLVKHSCVVFVVNLQQKLDYATICCKFAASFAIYADLFCKRQNGRRPQPHPGTQVTRCGCFLPDLTEFTSYCCGRTRASIDSFFLASLRSGEIIRHTQRHCKNKTRLLNLTA